MIKNHNRKSPRSPRFVFSDAEKVVRAYNRQFEQGYKEFTLKTLAEKAGISYGYVRKVKSQMDATCRFRQPAKTKRASVTSEVTQ